MTDTAAGAQPRAATAVLLAGAVLWGLNWLPLHHFAAAGLGGPSIAVASYGLVGALALPALWLQRAQWRDAKRQLALIALLGGWANAAFVDALVLGDVVRVMLLFYLAPVWGVLAGRLVLGEAIDRTRLVAIALAMGGAVVVLGAAAGHVGPPPGMADVLALSGGVAFALGNVATRAAGAMPLATKTAAIVIGCALLSALLLAADAPATPDSAPWGQVLLYALTWLLLATAATQYGVSHMQAGRAAVLLLAELVAAVASATLFGAASPRLSDWIGGALIVAGGLVEVRGGPVEPIAAAAPGTAPVPGARP